MKNKFLSIFLTTYFVFSSTLSAFASPVNNQNTENTPLEITAEAAILIDATTGEVLYEKNSAEKKYPASITKLMTLLLALEYGKMDEVLTFSKDAVFGIERNSSHIALDVGEQITMEQAIYAVILQSANEASLGIAEHISGSQEEFAKLMNKRAKELGCKNTNFVNPNGLHDENHYTTAQDMSLIAKELLKFDEFKPIIGTRSYQIPPTNKQTDTRYLYAQHQMIKPPSIFVYEGCEGGKTGFTNEAQNTLVTYAKRDDTELIAVTLKCSGANHYKDTTLMFDYGFNNFETKKILLKSDFAKTVPVVETYKKKTTQIDTINLKLKEDIYKTVKKNSNIDSITQSVTCEEKFIAPVNKDDTLGVLTISSQNEVIATADLISDKTVEGKTLEQKQAAEKVLWLNRVKIAGMLLCLFILFFIIFIIIIRIRNRRRYLKRRERNRRLRMRG